MRLSPLDFKRSIIPIRTVSGSIMDIEVKISRGRQDPIDAYTHPCGRQFLKVDFLITNTVLCRRCNENVKNPWAVKSVKEWLANKSDENWWAKIKRYVLGDARVHTMAQR